MDTLDARSAPPSSQTTTSTYRPSRVVAALGGLCATAFGLGLAELIAGTSASLRSPALSVGDRIIDLVPAWLKNIAIDLFGTNDKLVLLLSIAAMIAAFAAFMGVLGLRRNLYVAYAGIAGFGLAGSLSAIFARSGSSAFSPVPSIAGSLATAVGFWVLSRRLRVSPSADQERSTQEIAQPVAERRNFLTTSGVMLLGAALFSGLGRKLEARFSAADSRAAITLPQPVNPQPAISAAAQAPAAAQLFTPNSEFYRIDTALTVPQVPADSWTLRVKGLVDQPLSLSYEDLLGREIVEHDITLTCVSNTIGGDLVGTARWIGIRLDDLLADVGVQPEADQIVGRSVDGYTCGFPVSALDGRDALIAIGMNGEPLPLEHGFPARLIVPGLYGYVSATKWLSEIELTTFDAFDHYWVPRGYSAEAPIKMQSRIDAPRGLDRIDAGPFVIGGVAWAQTIGIESVELRIDEGDWQQATMAEEVNNTTWRQWSMPWEATPGRHSIEARAINRDGAIQTTDRTEPLPNGASGHHTVVVLVNEP